ncbi:MAG: tetratricopeptide repeat protein [Brumimicrobium sp.]|nr:tetratricopeptide repeat protein [Brumimicrobium sp.]
MKKYISFFIFLFGFTPLFSQDKVDSLFKEINKWQKKTGVAADTNLYNIYYQLGKIFQNSNPDTAIYYLDKSIVYAKQQKDKLKEGESIRNQGWCFYLKGDSEKAIQYYNQVLTIVEVEDGKERKKEKVKQLQAATIINIGTVYHNKGDYSKALDNYFKALKINEELGNKQYQAVNLGNIGLVYSNQDDDSKALEYYFKALKINEEIGNKQYQAAILGNIGIIS